jgi:hypothetical protein
VVVRSVLLWSLAAVAGLALAAAVTILASSLSSQHIGLSSEPLSAGEELAPGAAAPARRPARPRPPARTDQGTTPSPASSPAAPSGGEETGETSDGDD